jgi:hypothetical protein
VHATVSRGENAYVAECWEVAVEDEDLHALGLAPSPRLVVAYESPLENGPAAQTLLG